MLAVAPFVRAISLKASNGCMLCRQVRAPRTKFRVNSLDVRWLSPTMRQLQTGVSAAEARFDAPGCSTYEEAVRQLNTLQSNASYLAKTVSERDQKRHQQLALTEQCIRRLGLSLEDLDKLSVIHVTGTKGKGSTCAITERILREHGYKTGFFSSPHLVEVRERIRIGGLPISRDLFRMYFWRCFNELEASKADHDGYMPPYFQFLTVMAFYVFLKESVDVAVMEVGIGGEYDSTNIIRRPVVCGVSSLGIDHVALLGDTVEKIAWHKGGIFKSGSTAVTVPQPGSSLEVLQQRAAERGSSLYVAPSSILHYDWNGRERTLGIPGEKQEMNASLAAQMCRIWLENRERKNGTAPEVAVGEANTFQLSDAMVRGLHKCYWPGRCQTIRRPGVTIYIDGAHTPRSIEGCTKWFKDASRSEKIQGNVVKVLIFNMTGDRDPQTLLKPLVGCDFDYAVFCPNITTTVGGNKADQTNCRVTSASMLAKCQVNQNTWDDLTKPDHGEPNNNGQGSVSFGCILEALHWVVQGRDVCLPRIPVHMETAKTVLEADHVQILCTGSLHLVGGILGLVEPDVCEK